MTQMNTTYEDLHNYLGEMLGEPYGSYDKWTLSIRNLWLNKGIQKVAEILQSSVTSDDVTAVAGTASYDLSVSGTLSHYILDINDLEGIRYDGERIDHYTVDEMDVYDGDWRTATSGTCTKYMFDVNTKVLKLHPPPDDTKTIEVNYSYLPDKISDVTASPDLPEERKYAAAVWAAWKLYQGRRKFAQAKEYQKEFIDEMRTAMRNKELKPDQITTMKASISGFNRQYHKYGDT